MHIVFDTLYLPAAGAEGGIKINLSMKRIFTFLCLFAIVATAWASIKGYKSVLLNHTDGTSDIIAIEEDMTIEAAAGVLTLSCSKGDIAVSIAELRNWTYGTVSGDDNLWTGIESAVADGVVVRMGADCIELQNLPAGSDVMLTSIDGRVVKTVRVDGGYVSLPLADLRGGVYILTYNKKSLKIAVK